ncbi:right-handed parallel beta-helix repeat-containing protein [Micromonospora siamensis]|uniref:PKD domain-containing protein n=1 Tax=Micromonospora siamensis TaxID=299152 RepID=A0A1C5GYX0_9ACTN|nr:right-handed parallel beta-helix repeat-containing protein [Micromonospora siamensis]SCG39002.1 PKD domain-containing protein [Micromonospora siamensis]
MRKTSLAGLTALAVAGSTLLSILPARAADATTLWVHGYSDTCSDTGPGTQDQPFCTIGAAAQVVQAGQTVRVGAGAYRERVTVPRSGTPDQPITFTSDSGTARVGLVGPGSGFVVDGQHDIVIRRFSATPAEGLPGLDLRNSSAITVESFGAYPETVSTTPAVRLSKVTGATLSGISSSSATLVTAVDLDAATTGVTLTASSFSTIPRYDLPMGSVAVRVAGTGNTVTRSRIEGFSAAGILVAPGASGTVVSDNYIQAGGGDGIRNDSATGTAVTNNTVHQRCRDGVRIEGASTGVAVHNNVLVDNGYLGLQNCGRTGPGGVEIGVYGTTARDTRVDYNDVFHTNASSPQLYSWGTPLGLAAFRTATGQAAHDRESRIQATRIDSANSAAPGYPTIDYSGLARADDPNVPDTGAGPITYADRGAFESVQSPVARLDPAIDLGTSTVTLDASTSTAGLTPIASYRFDFGDGTVVTQASPVASHRYATLDTYRVSVTVTGGDKRTGTVYDDVTLLPRIGTIGLLARSNLRYVGPSTSGGARADRAGLDAGSTFDVVDAGNGRVALYSRSARRYLAADQANQLTLVDAHVSGFSWLRLIRNSDGSLTISANSGYVSTSGSGGTLVAGKTTVGKFEQFHDVKVSDANRTFKARSNARYVTASNTAATPLAATATGVGVAQKYDLVNLGNYQWALFARANNRFVTASLGTQPLINTKTIPGTWERFVIVHNSDGSVSLRSAGNSRYVTADSTKPLIANAGTIGPRQQYTLG